MTKKKKYFGLTSDICFLARTFTFHKSGKKFTIMKINKNHTNGECFFLLQQLKIVNHFENCQGISSKLLVPFHWGCISLRIRDYLETLGLPESSENIHNSIVKENKTIISSKPIVLKNWKKIVRNCCPWKGPTWKLKYFKPVCWEPRMFLCMKIAAMVRFRDNIPQNILECCHKIYSCGTSRDCLGLTARSTKICSLRNRITFIQEFAGPIQASCLSPHM